MIVISIIAVAVLTACDQIFKYLVLNNLKPIGSVTLIPNLLEFKYIENSGAAFGVLQDYAWMFSILTMVMCVLIVVYMVKEKKHTFFSYAASIMVIAGGIGNLIDRIVLGYVVDFIHVMFFDYIFNFADCLVVVGVCLFIIHVLFFMDKPKKKVETEKNGE